MTTIAPSPLQAMDAHTMNAHHPHRRSSLAHSETSKLHRSGSSNSGSSTTGLSYVALMRKQKATVWSDKTQPDDPRQAAAAKMARLRAAAEISGGSGRTMTSLAAQRKYRSGALKTTQYSAIQLVGSTGVPLRLSAKEVGDEFFDDDEESVRRGTMMSSMGAHHKREGSGRSGGSGGRNTARTGTMTTGTGTRSPDESSPPDTAGSTPSHSKTATMLSRTTAPGSDYASGSGGDSPSAGSIKSASNLAPLPSEYRAQSMTAASNPNAGPSGAVVARKPLAPLAVQRLQKLSAAEELARRGSVDERTTTMKGSSRLFVANPDD